ncbi:MAG: hypothetical protein AAF768_13130 [Pseudomonadota bacterium]
MIIGLVIAFELWSMTSPSERMTANGGTPNLERCEQAQDEVEIVLAKPAPTRTELQALIAASADYCVIYEHGFVVSPICTAYPDACMGELEENLR